MHGEKIWHSINKCAVVSYIRGKSPITYSYCVDHISIARQLKIRDLGIQFDDRLYFTQHIETICNSASRSLVCLFLIRSCRNFFDVTALKLLFLGSSCEIFCHASLNILSKFPICFCRIIFVHTTFHKFSIALACVLYDGKVTIVTAFRFNNFLLLYELRA